jgi:ribonuclease BN (tRNA processing enzyme)
VSGDTTYSPELIALAKGAELVHEVTHLGGFPLSRVPKRAARRKHLIDSHATETHGTARAFKPGVHCASAEGRF